MDCSYFQKFLDLIETYISPYIKLDKMFMFITLFIRLLQMFYTLKYFFQVWGCDIIVDWADPQEEPDEGTMSKVKVLYVRNLTQDISEDKIKVRSAF